MPAKKSTTKEVTEEEAPKKASRSAEEEAPKKASRSRVAKKKSPDPEPELAASADKAKATKDASSEPVEEKPAKAAASKRATSPKKASAKGAKDADAADSAEVTDSTESSAKVADLKEEAANDSKNSDPVEPSSKEKKEEKGTRRRSTKVQTQHSSHQQNSSRQNSHRQRRNRNQQKEYAPSVSKEELAALKVPELRERAAEINIDASGMKKAEMVEAIYVALAIAEGFIEVEGILDIMQDGYGFLRTQGYLPSEKDVYVSLSTIRRNGLRKGDTVSGHTRPAREGEKFAAIQKVSSVNGIEIEKLEHRAKFADLTPVYPDERLMMEHGKDSLTARVIDLASPVGKGQRGLIVSPPKAGKTTVLKDIAASIHANNPEVHLMCLLVDERPEEVTDMQRSIHGEVIASTFDMPSENHIAVAELVIERAKRLVEQGRDVVILLDSITRLARAYNLAQPASGRILSGGVDSTALYPPKRFLGAARNIEGGGSLTILASALIDTGSKMDEVIFEEFKGTGNMEIRLDRNLADRRIFPAIDVVASGTRKEELLLDAQEAPLIWAVRRVLANANNPERSMDMLIKSLSKTDTNAEFLIKTARRAKSNSRMDENFAL